MSVVKDRFRRFGYWECLRAAQWDRFFAGLEALYAGAVYGTTEGKVHELSYARCLKFLLHA